MPDCAVAVSARVAWSQAPEHHVERLPERRSGRVGVAGARDEQTAQQRQASDEVSEDVGVEVDDLAARDGRGDERPHGHVARLLVGGAVRLETEQGWPVDQRDPPDLLVERGVQVGVHLGHDLVDRRLLRVSGSRPHAPAPQPPPPRARRGTTPPCRRSGGTPHPW